MVDLSIVVNNLPENLYINIYNAFKNYNWEIILINQDEPISLELKNDIKVQWLPYFDLDIIKNIARSKTLLIINTDMINLYRSKF